MASRRFSAAFVTCALAASLTVLGGGAKAAASCASAGHPGGDWASYGQNVTNARNQTSESLIDAGNVGGVTAAWAATATGMGGAGAFYSTPVISGGCVFLTAAGGFIVALNADTGEVVWSRQELGSLNFAPAVVDGVVYANLSLPGIPYVVALDEATGDVIWRSFLYEQVLDGEATPLGIEASAVVTDGMVFVPLTGHDLFDFSHPSYFILEATTGRRMKKTTVIPKDDWTALYSGGGIWTTAAVDERNKYLYVGTANPYNKRAEHDFTDSIMKIDIDRSRLTTFGTIVGNYKGENDYDPELYHSPQCTYLSELIVVGYSPVCGQKDIDFGASPNVYTTRDGRTIVGDLQKNCTYHAVDTATMQPVWLAQHLGQGGVSGCASTSAYDDTNVYVNVNGGKMFAFDKETGAQAWRTEYGDPGSKYQPVTVANGVVYTLGNNGHLYGFDAADGSVVLDTLMAGPSGVTCGSTSGAGVAIARNTIYAACDSGSGRTDTGAVFAFTL